MLTRHCISKIYIQLIVYHYDLKVPLSPMHIAHPTSQQYWGVLFHPIITTPCQSQSKLVMRPLSTMVLTPILILLPSPHYRQDMTRQQREDSSMHKHYAKPNEFPKRSLHGAELTVWGTVGGCSIYWSLAVFLIHDLAIGYSDEDSL